MRPGAWPLADDDVEFEILHRGIEDFLDIRLKPVDLVDEQNIANVEIRQNGRQIAFQLNEWTGCCAKPRPHFIGDDGCQRRLSEAGRTVKKDVIERLSPL